MQLYPHQHLHWPEQLHSGQSGQSLSDQSNLEDLESSFTWGCTNQGPGVGTFYISQLSLFTEVCFLSWSWNTEDVSLEQTGVGCSRAEKNWPERGLAPGPPQSNAVSKLSSLHWTKFPSPHPKLEIPIGIGLAPMTVGEQLLMTLCPFVYLGIGYFGIIWFPHLYFYTQIQLVTKTFSGFLPNFCPFLYIPGLPPNTSPYNSKLNYYNNVFRDSVLSASIQASWYNVFLSFFSNPGFSGSCLCPTFSGNFAHWRSLAWAILWAHLVFIVCSIHLAVNFVK